MLQAFWSLFVVRAIGQYTLSSLGFRVSTGDRARRCREVNQ
ncbi:MULTISPECIES: hypothetical protein [unclassified Microcoleus]|nr:MULTISPECIES: hypothetical protein [unclassified Microcoleus]